MRITGIIAEYNPFHRGHEWHIEEARRRTGGDYVVICMDGHFTQRGEPAAFSKWARARMALSCGADAVFELPTLFAVRTADAFARGGVSILGGLGVDALSFGCELDDPVVIAELAELQKKEPTSVSESIESKLREGKSHARAWGEAVAEHLNLPCDVINQPNLILAVEYARAAMRLYPRMEIHPIKRRGAYHDERLSVMASSTAIRAAFDRGARQEALACIPERARPFAEPDEMHPMDDLLLWKLRSMSPEALRALPDVAEGLEQRLYALCRSCSTRAELLAAMKCKRYTHARLSRLLTHALLDVSQAMADAWPTPRYARLLGLRHGAEPLLAELDKRSGIEIISAPRRIRDDPVFQLECRATDTWTLLHNRAEERLPGREFTEKFVRV